MWILSTKPSRGPLITVSASGSCKDRVAQPRVSQSSARSVPSNRRATMPRVICTRSSSSSAASFTSTLVSSRSLAVLKMAPRPAAPGLVSPESIFRARSSSSTERLFTMPSK